MAPINGQQCPPAAAGGQRNGLKVPLAFQLSRNPDMKKAIQVAVLASLLTSFSAFAHHPAQAIVDADTWLMIDENLQEVDSPHLDLDFTMM
jgi:hypothetical protein